MQVSALRMEAVIADFRFAATHLFKDSLLYRHLSQCIIEDHQLLQLAAHAKPEQPPVLMLFAAVRYLLLQGVDHPLKAAYQDSATGQAMPDLFPVFRDFCLQNDSALQAVIAKGQVQTNEVGRSVYLRLAMDWVSREVTPERISLLDLGACAGLNLIWDHYGIQFTRDDEKVVLAGDVNSPVRIPCRLTGNPIPRELGEVAELTPEARVGLELTPPDLDDPDQVRWLQSFVWADHPERDNRFLKAVEMLQQADVQVQAANVVEKLYPVGAAMVPDTLLCVTHTFLVSQLPPASQQALDQQFDQLAQKRDLIRIGVEPQGDGFLLSGQRWENGYSQGWQPLAWGHPHGVWVKWVHES